jgi:hypothetical protein
MAGPQDIDDVTIPEAPAAGQRRGFPESFRIPLAVGFTRQREMVRTVIAVVLLGVLTTLTLGMLFASIYGPLKDPELKELVTSLFTPILGVFGTVTGFYYGSHAADQGAQSSSQS